MVFLRLFYVLDNLVISCFSENKLSERVYFSIRVHHKIKLITTQLAITHSKVEIRHIVTSATFNGVVLVSLLVVLNTMHK